MSMLSIWLCLSAVVIAGGSTLLVLTLVSGPSRPDYTWSRALTALIAVAALALVAYLQGQLLLAFALGCSTVLLGTAVLAWDFLAELARFDSSLPPPPSRECIGELETVPFPERAENDVVSNTLAAGPRARKGRAA